MESEQSDLHNDHKTDEDNTDAILAELEAETDDTNATAYQERMRELRAIVGQSSNNSAQGFCAVVKQDSYHNLKSDDDTLRFTTEHAKAVVHFRHPDFARCSIMDEHLDRIAQRHNFGETGGEEIAFARADVTNTPFVVEKLGIRILPCVIGFAKGVVKGKVVGFEGICWDSKEKDPRVSKALEDTLFSWGLLKQKMLADDHDTDSDGESDDDTNQVRDVKIRRGIRGPKQKVLDEGDDWD